MPKKKARPGRPSKTPKKQISRAKVFVVAALVVVAVGVGAMMMGGGGDGEIPPAKLSDGRVVVLEFFDFG